MDEQPHMTIEPRDLWAQFRAWWGALRLWIKIALALAVVAGIGFAVAQFVGLPSSSVAQLRLFPDIAGVQAGGALEVQVLVGNQSQNVQEGIFAVEAEITFDVSRLAISAAECSTAVTKACISGAGSAFGTRVEQTVSGNTIRIIRGAPAPGVTAASATLVTLRFSVNGDAAGTADVGITQSNSNVVIVRSGQAQDILAAVQGGSYTIGALTCGPSGIGGFECGAAVGGNRVCGDGVNRGRACAQSDPDCPLYASPDCNASPGIERCTSGAGDDRACQKDEDCQEFAVCGAASLCLGSELPDDEPATVCCSIPCGVADPLQLYIQGVTVSTDTSDETEGAERITWTTFPATATHPVCNVRVDGGTEIASGGVGAAHSVVVTDLTVDELHRFSIICRLSGYKDAVYSEGTFTIPASTADRLAILDLAVTDVTYRSARVTYGTNKTAFGALSFCGTGFTQTSDTVATLAHQAVLQGLTPHTEYCVEVNAAVERDSTAGHLLLPLAAPKQVRFTTPDQPTLIPDANVIMKVTRDRVCKQWLYCQSSVKLKGSADPLCYDLGVCDTLDPSGACANPVTLEAAIAKAPMTFATPASVNFIKDISGYANAGLDWGPDAALQPRVIKGLYPYVRMEETGRTVRVQNGNFESGQIAPWRAQGGAALTPVRGEFDARNNPSYALKAVPGAGVYTGARVPLGPLFSSDEPLRVTFRAGAVTEGKPLKVQLAALSGISDEFFTFVSDEGAQELALTTGWKTYQMRLGALPEDGGLPRTFAGEAALQFVQQRHCSETTARACDVRLNCPGNEECLAPPGAFFIDDVRIEPSLEAGSALALPRACRLYPKPDAPACDFLELSSGKDYRGWKGYCVERQDPDPLDANDPDNPCLIWWPVDVLIGSADLFASEEVAGYKDRKPLYYCLAAKGNMPYGRYVKTDRVYSSYRINNGEREVNNDRLIQEIESGAFNDHSGLLIFDQTNAAPITPDAGLFSSLLGSLLVGSSQLRTTDGALLRDFKEQEIALINVLVTDGNGDMPVGKRFSLTANNGWEAAHCQNEGCNEDDPGIYTRAPSPFYWQKIVANLKDDPDGSYIGCQGTFSEGDSTKPNLIGIKFRFDDSGALSTVEAGLCDGSDGAGKVHLDFEVYLREWCTTLAQVVTPDGDAVPFTSRVSGGWNDQGGNTPQYPHNADFAPYGGVVPPGEGGADPGDPVSWPKGQPAFIEAPLTSFGQQAPYQYRGGAPYGLQRAGSLSLEESGRICVSGSGDRIGKSCENNPDCGTAFGTDGGQPVSGVCTGIEKPKSIIGWNDFYAKLGTGAAGGRDIVDNLFARAYDTWAFDGGEGKYKLCIGDDAPAGIGCVGAWDASASALPATQPRVLEIRVEDKSSGDAAVLKRAGGVTLRFTASVDGDHAPMTAWRVDWGDGSRITEVAGLRINPRSSMNDPHIALHTYQCAGAESPGWDTGTGECRFTPAVQVVDNWGMCNGGAGAQCAASFVQNPNVWAAYQGTIRVVP